MNQRRRIPRWGYSRRQRLLQRGRLYRDIDTYRRYHALFLLTGGLSIKKIHELIGMARSTVYSVLDRFYEEGLGGLEDRRRNNGSAKVEEKFIKIVADMVGNAPMDYGWCRPTWTRELLCKTMKRRYRVEVSECTMGRVLADLGARLKRPRPVVYCPWRAERRKRRIRQIKRLVENLPKNEVAFYEDEVDIHLNPKIGRDWMLPGQQKLAITPGKNEKRYVAGALNTRNESMIWIEGKSKRSSLFCDFVDQIMAACKRYKKVHLILDNYIIHKSKITQRRLKKYQGRLELHFLPPYCPNANPIERKWRDLHDEVTRNHRCATMQELMRRVRAHLNRVGQRYLEPLRINELGFFENTCVRES